MKNVAVVDTRNFALVGHSHDGKTTLGEALLHAAGAIPVLGHVDDGSAVLLTQPEEKERKSTFSSATFGFDWNGKHLTLVDTPGDPNFLADGQIALSALDAGILVLSAVDGAKVGTETMWRSARRTGVSLLAFVSGLDRDRADLGAAVESLEKIDAKPALLVLPIGSGEALSGVVDLLRMKAIVDGKEGEIPADLVDDAAKARERLVEAVAECDDVLLEKYLEEGELSDDEVQSGLIQAAKSGQLMPVLCGSATREIGIDLLLRDLVELLPSPIERGDWSGTDVDSSEERAVAPDPEGVFSAVVMKTIIDRYAGTLSVFRIVSGTLHHDTAIVNASKGA